VLRKHSQVFVTLLYFADLAVVSVAWLASYHIRFSSGLFPSRGEAPLGVHLLAIIPIIVAWSLSLKFFGLYRPRRTDARVSEMIDVGKASIMSMLLLVALAYFIRDIKIAREVFLIFGAFATASLSVERALFRAALRYARKKNYNQRSAVIVGTGAAAADTLERIAAHPEYGIRVIGFVSSGEGDDTHATGDVKVIGDYSDIRRIIRQRSITHVFVALGLKEHANIVKVLELIGDEAVDIKVVPDVYELVTLRGGIEDLGGIPVVSLRDTPFYGWNLVLKRAADVAISAVAIAAFSPVMVLIAALVKLTSPGPVLYSQERMSLGGEVFRMYKFRSMRVDAEAETGPVFASRGDERCTLVGAILRRTSLDELPQLFHVLGGRMSLVGPRPERPTLIERFRRSVPGYMLRHKVRAGMTGWAQVNSLRGSTDIGERVKYDLYYIENWSLVFDIRILWLTIFRGFWNRNAY
jgi:Undecaprenyl-phosphate glucose phosphotransferase